MRPGVSTSDAAREWEARSLRFSGAPLFGPQAGEPPAPCEVGGGQGGVRGPHLLFGWGVGGEDAGDRSPPAAFALSQDAVSRCNEDIGRITVASFGVAFTAGHTGRDPFFNLGFQPTHRVRGELATGRKLSPTLQTPERRPRHSPSRPDPSAPDEARV